MKNSSIISCRGRVRKTLALPRETQVNDLSLALPSVGPYSHLTRRKFSVVFSCNVLLLRLESSLNISHSVILLINIPFVMDYSQ